MYLLMNLSICIALDQQKRTPLLLSSPPCCSYMQLSVRTPHHWRLHPSHPVCYTNRAVTEFGCNTPAQDIIVVEVVAHVAQLWLRLVGLVPPQLIIISVSNKTPLD